MNKGTKITVAVISILGLAGLAYFVYQKFDTAIADLKGKLGGKKSKPDSPVRPTGLIVPGGSVGTGGKFPLKRGSKGDEVLKLQKLINLILPYYPGIRIARLDEDGNWGTKTNTALKALGVPVVITEEQYYRVENMLKNKGKTDTGKYVYNMTLQEIDQWILGLFRSADGNKIPFPGFGTFKKKNAHGRMSNQTNQNQKPFEDQKVRRNIRNRKITKAILQDIFTNNFNNQKIYRDLENLPDSDFENVYNMFNKINRENGHQRTLPYEIRGVSTIENDEELLFRFDYLNLP